MTPVDYSPINHNAARIARIAIDNPPVNATSTAVRAGLAEAIAHAERDGCTLGVIVCCGKTFVAGGDIAEFKKAPQEPHLPDVYWQLEQSPVMWAAAMHGTVLGGGFELAMACHLRVAMKDTRFGLPEVNLGLIPGAGGTQRLPRLVGVELAVELASSGRMISAQSLFDKGGIDLLVDDNVETHAIELLCSTSSRPKNSSERSITAMSNDFFAQAKADVEKKAKGAKAPLLNIKAIEWAVKSEFSEGQKRERKLHLELRDSDQSIALRHAFFAERSVSKPAAIHGAQAKGISRITVVGGGLMGAGISAACLNAGLEVHLIEMNDEGAQAAKARVEGLLEGALKRGKIDQTKFKAQCKAFSSGCDYNACSNADIAIEAVYEDLTIKQQVFKSLAAHLPDKALLATNTSYINPNEIADGVLHPERILGLHFFSPAHIMKLLEIVATDKSSAETLATAFALARKINKVGVLSGVCDGFIGNRMLAVYRRQADYLLADGANVLQIDAAMRAYGMPMGPYELQDLTGLQIGWANRKRQAATRAPQERYVDIADKLCEMERFGQRSGLGWYRYESGSRTPIVDESIDQLVLAYAKEQGIKRREFSELEIQQSMTAVLANEGMRLLEEGVAERALDIDMVKIHGYGFPRWRGGPMHAAEVAGKEAMAKILDAVCKQSPNSWILAKGYRR